MPNKKEKRLLLQKTLGKHIKLNRQKLNFTHQKVAEDSSLTFRYVGKIEYGESLPNAQTPANLFIILAIDPNGYIADYKAQSKFLNDK